MTRVQRSVGRRATGAGERSGVLPPHGEFIELGGILRTNAYDGAIPELKLFH